ncbi:MAG: DNA-methyltransferase [Verrucomicrobiota bacterium]
MGAIEVHFSDNLPVLHSLADDTVNLVYIDPPFNTGKIQARTQIRTTRDEGGDRTGFQGRRYRTTPLGQHQYADTFDEYLAFLEPRLIETRRILAENGSLFFHIDCREAHYCKILLDSIFGRECFINEIIWAYDYGGRSKRKWPAKHDTIFWYAKNPKSYTFNLDECDRIPYMAPALVGPEKAKRGKTPTDTWWHTIVGTNGKEKTGYPTQKPRGVIDRIVRVHSNPGDLLCDFFAGSGTLGESAAALNRRCILVDSNPAAIDVMRQRLRTMDVTWHASPSTDSQPSE